MIRHLAKRGWRQLSLLLTLLLVCCLLADRLYALQVGVSAASRTTLERYYSADVAVPQAETPPRGTILDDKGDPLVSTVTVYKLAASPALVPVNRKAAVARILTDVLFPLRLPTGSNARSPKHIQKAKDTYLAHYNAFLAQLDASWNYVCLAGDDSYTCPFHNNLSQNLLTTILGRIDKLGISGISDEPRSQPMYPNGPLAAQVLGYVDYTYPKSGSPVDTGVYGVQQRYDNLLAGIPGHTTIRFDTKGNPVRVGTGADTPPQAGATLRLTLDSYIQFIVEQDLNQIIAAQHATGGTIIVERPSDGAILAMASAPSYDPNTWNSLVQKLAKHAGYGTKTYSSTKFMHSLYTLFPNPAVSEQYEPGSTFKSFTVAIGFDTGLFNETTRVNDSGDLYVDGTHILNWCTNSCPFGGLETPSVMLHYSSNIGAAQFGRVIPAPLWYQYLERRFGFGQKTGVDVAGEIGGTVIDLNSKNPPLEPIDKDTQAYGQGISVTPLQLANAYAALANGGLLPTPHILQSYSLAGNTVTPSWKPIGRAISQKTSSRMISLLVKQAVAGESCKALVPGYDIAAKTGTASIPNAQGGYSTTSAIASTAAFGPVGDDLAHQFVVLVKVDRPAAMWGSEVAAPVVRDIYSHLFQHYSILPTRHPVQPANGVCHDVNETALDPWPPAS